MTDKKQIDPNIMVIRQIPVADGVYEERLDVNQVQWALVYLLEEIEKLKEERSK